MYAIAINNSPPGGGTCRGWPSGLVALLAAFVQISSAQTNPAPEPTNFTAYAETILSAARARYQREPTNAGAVCQFGRACFDRGEFATNDTERATLAVEGIDAMRQLVEREPKLAAGHFYLAMNLGQFARTKLLGALKIVEEMEREFKAARELDEHFEYAGPDRNLGQLYFQAPGWPASVGNRSKARRHWERAVELAPDYPENHLNLLEACIKWNNQKDIRRELKAIEALWPAAKTNFTGEAWASSWADWEKRLSELKARGARSSH
jgi:tetratricopeptide (TPR) repeat protein